MNEVFQPTYVIIDLKIILSQEVRGSMKHE